MQSYYNRLGPKKSEKCHLIANALRIDFEDLQEKTELLNPGPNKGSWRAFQIAFILMTVEVHSITRYPR